MHEFSVLIVDDEPVVRTALARILAREGYHLTFAGSGVEALELVNAGGVDLVIADNRMPEMTGLELFLELRRTHPDVIRIIITGHADFETVRSAINEAGIYRFFSKPWDDHDLKLTVRTAMERRLLERENRRLLEEARQQQQRLDELERLHPGISTVDRDASGAIVIKDEE